MAGLGIGLENILMTQYSFHNVNLNLGLGSDGTSVQKEQVKLFSNNNATISVGRAANQHSKVIGGYGELNVVTDSDLSGFCSFTLLQTSNWNSTLYNWAATTHSDIISRNRENLSKKKFLPIQGELVDLSGNTVCTLTNGFIARRPVIVRGQMTNDVTWNIEFGVVDFDVKKPTEVIDNAVSDVKDKLTDVFG